MRAAATADRSVAAIVCKYPGSVNGRRGRTVTGRGQAPRSARARPHACPSGKAGGTRRARHVVSITVGGGCNAVVGGGCNAVAVRLSQPSAVESGGGAGRGAADGGGGQGPDSQQHGGGQTEHTAAGAADSERRDGAALRAADARGWLKPSRTGPSRDQTGARSLAR